MSRFCIINYHYCTQPNNGNILENMRGVPAKVFDEQLNALTRSVPPVRLTDLTEDVDMGHELRSLITFDDGTKDVYENALPALQRRNVPAVIFCCSQPYLEGRVMGVQKTHLLSSVLGWEGFRTKFMGLIERRGVSWEPFDYAPLGLSPMYRYDDEATRRFKFLLNVEIPYHVLEPLLDDIFEDVFGSQKEAARAIYMSLDDLKRCMDSGIALGLHTHSHRMLSRLVREEQLEELRTPLEFFRDALSLGLDTLSYPYGIPGSWNEDTESVMRELGITHGFSLGRTVYDSAAAPHALRLPRFDVNDFFQGGNIRANMLEMLGS